MQERIALADKNSQNCKLNLLPNLRREIKKKEKKLSLNWETRSITQVLRIKKLDQVIRHV